MKCLLNDYDHKLPEVDSHPRVFECARNTFVSSVLLWCIMPHLKHMHGGILYLGTEHWPSP